MPDHNNETTDFFTKAAIYIAGTVIGIGAKLATMNQDAKLTAKQIFFHSMVAFATAWCVWFMLEDKINSNVLVSISVVIGRFGDKILLAIGKAVMQWLKDTTKNDL
jgi:hypothetical protein